MAAEPYPALPVTEAFLDALADRVAAKLAAPTTTDPAREWMTAAQAAEYTTLAVGTIRNLTSQKRIPHHLHGTRVVYRRGELDAFLSQR
jgi:excisionase family DNA binding protein